MSFANDIIQIMEGAEDAVFKSANAAQLQKRKELRALKPGNTFGNYLKNLDRDISLELIIADVDPSVSFVWNKGDWFTPEGEDYFSPLLNASYEVLPNGNIVVNCNDEDLGEYFLYAAAGHISSKEYDKLFTPGVFALGESEELVFKPATRANIKHREKLVATTRPVCDECGESDEVVKATYNIGGKKDLYWECERCNTVVQRISTFPLDEAIDPVFKPASHAQLTKRGEEYPILRAKNVREADKILMDKGVEFEDRIWFDPNYIYFVGGPNGTHVAYYDPRTKIIEIEDDEINEAEAVFKPASKAQIDKRLEGKWRILDLQNSDFFTNDVFDSLEDIRQRLASFHSVDWHGEGRDIEDLSLDELLDYGSWDVEKVDEAKPVFKPASPEQIAKRPPIKERTIDDVIQYLAPYKSQIGYSGIIAGLTNLKRYLNFGSREKVIETLVALWRDAENSYLEAGIDYWKESVADAMNACHLTEDEEQEMQEEANSLGV